MEAQHQQLVRDYVDFGQATAFFCKDDTPYFEYAICIGSRHHFVDEDRHFESEITADIRSESVSHLAANIIFTRRSHSQPDTKFDRHSELADIIRGAVETRNPMPFLDYLMEHDLGYDLAEKAAEMAALMNQPEESARD